MNGRSGFHPAAAIPTALLFTLVSCGALADTGTQRQNFPPPLKSTVLAPSSSNAANAQKALRNRTCAAYASLFKAIAAARDQGENPGQGLEDTARFAHIPLYARKNAVRLVYFDPGFKKLSGQALALQVFQVCVYGPPDAFQSPE